MADSMSWTCFSFFFWGGGGGVLDQFLDYVKSECQRKALFAFSVYNRREEQLWNLMA